MHARDAALLHIMPSHIAVVVWAQGLTDDADVVVTSRASAGVTIIVVRKKRYSVFCVLPPVPLPPKFTLGCTVLGCCCICPNAPCHPGLGTFTAASSILSASSLSLLPLHLHSIHHGLLDHCRCFATACSAVTVCCYATCVAVSFTMLYCNIMWLD